MRCHLTIFAIMTLAVAARADSLPIVTDVEGQPLGQNVARLLQALDLLGSPLAKEATDNLQAAADARDVKKIQELLDPNVLVMVGINPESRVKLTRGPAEATLQQNGYTVILVKIVNEGTVKKGLQIHSPQAGPRQKTDYARTIAEVERRIKDKEITAEAAQADIAKLKKQNEEFKNRFLHMEVFSKRPMTETLSGLGVEYAIALIYSGESGKREATIGFDVGQGTQDLGFRGETAILFDIKPAIPVTLKVTDYDGKPTVGRFTFRDKQGRVYPAKANRLAPDMFFQDQVYRPDGGTVMLPPGELVMTYGRGPEYRQLQRKITVPQSGKLDVAVKLERCVNTTDFGFYSGDHHIHAAGCAHYTVPTEGVQAEDMLLHVKGEGLNVGCNLTWGPCYDYQRQYFEPTINKLSEPFCVLKYDIEVSGFGSQAMGHVCLLNLRDQTYPGSDGTKVRGWPKWTTPVMRWTKEQGGVAGYAHSGSGLMFDPPANGNMAARGIVTWLDKNKNGVIDGDEAAAGVLPEASNTVDANSDGMIDANELLVSINRVKNKLPNLAIPPMNGIGAQEICVSTAMGVCDFISAMDTARVPEWICWYHIMNCGFPLKASGETDFPCISGSRVGEGRVYVQLGKVDMVDFGKWCEGIAKGRSYVSDGYAHALDFRVGEQPMGGQLDLKEPGKVKVSAKVAFASETPLGTAKGGQVPQGNQRRVELIVNGKVADSVDVPANDNLHVVEFNVPIERSSWVALRQFPQMHTNPVNVIVAGKPIRASRSSAQWCLGVIDQLWRVRGGDRPEKERVEARKTFDKAIEMYKKIAEESPEGS